MRMTDVKVGEEYAQDASRDYRRFRWGVQRVRVDEVGVPYVSHSGWYAAGTSKKGVRVTYLDPETGEPIDTYRRTVVLPQSIRATWPEWVKESAALAADERRREKARKQKAHDDEVERGRLQAALDAALGDDAPRVYVGQWGLQFTVRGDAVDRLVDALR